MTRVCETFQPVFLSLKCQSLHSPNLYMCYYYLRYQEHKTFDARIVKLTFSKISGRKKAPENSR